MGGMAQSVSSAVRRQSVQYGFRGGAGARATWNAAAHFALHVLPTVRLGE